MAPANCHGGKKILLDRQPNFKPVARLLRSSAATLGRERDAPVTAGGTPAVRACGMAIPGHDDARAGCPCHSGARRPHYKTLPLTSRKSVSPPPLCHAHARRKRVENPGQM